MSHPDVDVRDALRIDLPEALRIAAKHNLGLVLEKEALLSSRLGVDAADGTFEPILTGGYRYIDSSSIVESTVQGMAGDTFTSRQHSWWLEVSKQFRTGANVSLAWSNNRATSLRADAVGPLIYSSGVSIRVSQPILRGFSLDLEIPRINILKARVGVKRQREQVRIAMVDVIQRTEEAYWSLVRALKTFEVRRDSLALAEDQMQRTTRRIRAGLLPPADEIEAERTRAQRSLELIQAKRGINATSDGLRAVLNLPYDAWARPLVPVDSPTFEPTRVTVEEAFKVARDNRPEARQAELAVKGAVYDLRAAENLRLPQVDVSLGYSADGQDDRYGGALQEIARRDAPEFQASVSLSWSPFNVRGGADMEIAQSGKRQAEIQHRQSVLAIFGEVRGAVRDYDSAQREVQAAARFRVLAQRSFDAEQRRFKDGRSSNFRVAQSSQSVAQAQLAELGALIDLRMAAVRLKRATGQLLESRGIVLE